MSNKLKPCPFCGGKAHMHEYTEELPFSEERNTFFVCCPGCGCQPFHFSEICLYYKSDSKERKKQLKKQAIEAWNRRAIPSKVETNIFDKEEVHENCTVQVLTNSVTGECSVGWWKNK